MTPSSALDARAILTDAAARAGAGDDGDPSQIVEPLTILVESASSEAGFSEEGAQRAYERITNLVASYLSVQRDQRLDPEILDVPVDHPIVIVGLPRSGTTLLHSLVSADPRHRSPTWWESLRPSPPPEAATFVTDPRRRQVQAEIDALVERSPEILSALPMSADLAAECNTLMQPCLRTVAFAAYFDVPTYQSWYLDTDQSAMYAYHRRALQQLGWRGPAARWSLKAPPHLFFMDLLSAEYPDASIVQIHRDPVKTIASTANLTLSNRRVYADHVDPADVGRQTLDLWALGIERSEAFRELHPDVRVIDVLYRDLVSDPIATIGSLYEQLEIELSSDAVIAMDTWMQTNAREKRPVHVYSNDEYGLSIDEIDDRFAAYPRTSRGAGRGSTLNFEASPDFRLDGRTAIVTGVGPGIGGHVAAGFVNAGANVALFARSTEHLDEIAHEIKPGGSSILKVGGDASRRDDLARLVDATTERFGAVDIVFSSAHANPAWTNAPDDATRGQLPDKDALSYTDADWAACFDVNVLATYRLAQLVVPGMVERRRGSIITVLSTTAFLPADPVIAYGTTKAALAMMTRYLAKACAPHVRVNAVCPGQVSATGEEWAAHQANLAKLPLGRIGRASEVVGAALFLASDASSFTTGQTIFVDGGKTNTIA